MDRGIIMNQKQSCPNCDSSPARSVFTIRPGNRVLECTGCKLQFAEVYPEYEKADAEIYSYEYFRDAVEKNPRRERVFAELLVELESVLNGKGRLLDIGAGEGTLIKVANERGWEAEGTELSSVMIKYIREDLGFTIHQGILEDISLPAASFDAIVLNHVLEHVKNPKTTLEKVGELLRPDGLVRIEIPNLASLSSHLKSCQSKMRLKKNPWKHYSTDHHFWFFTPVSLTRTLETAGLSLVTMRAPARQWGKMNFIDRAKNNIYERTFWGGHLVAYARPHA